jgi:hypothetical protein
MSLLIDKTRQERELQNRQSYLVQMNPSDIQYPVVKLEIK